MYEFIIPTSTLAALGFVLSACIAVAAKIFYFPTDERVLEIEGALAGLNCGMCGYGSCNAYAEAIVHEQEAVDKCVPGGTATARAVAQLMGHPEPDTAAARWTPQVHCRGNSRTARLQFAYRGIADCRAAALIHGGPKQCVHGCISLGSCMQICPVSAIAYNQDGLVQVDAEICISCGRCVRICPTKVMRWIPADADYLVACNSTEKGPVVKAQCQVGCIACKKCEKTSSNGGFHVTNFLSRIDYQATGERTAAADACPTGCIRALPQ